MSDGVRLRHTLTLVTVDFRWDLTPFQGYLAEFRFVIQQEKKLEGMLSQLGMNFGF